MKIITDGLVLREVKLGEADRILTLLSPDLGIISVSAKGSLRPKSKLFSASGLFIYSEWSLFEGRNIFRVDEASPLEVFFGLRESIEGISLAAYIADMLQILSPTGEEAGRLLRLALNSFHLLAEYKAEPGFVKMVFELRCLSESGFMPDILACAGCGKYEGGMFFFDIRRGGLLCEDCAQVREYALNLDVGGLAALRHILLSEEKNVFRFSLKPESFVRLAEIAESYVLYNLDYQPKSLRFLKTVL